MRASFRSWRHWYSARSVTRARWRGCFYSLKRKWRAMNARPPLRWKTNVSARCKWIARAYRSLNHALSLPINGRTNRMSSRPGDLASQGRGKKTKVTLVCVLVGIHSLETTPETETILVASVSGVALSVIKCLWHLQLNIRLVYVTQYVLKMKAFCFFSPFFNVK